MDSKNTGLFRQQLVEEDGEEDDDEEEEDFEGYFLRPANEYNIHDKIKEANQELFTELKMSAGVDELAAVNRKVTFRENLEDFEPDDDDDELSMLQSLSSSESIVDEVVEEEVIIEQEEVILANPDEDEEELALDLETKLEISEKDDDSLESLTEKPQKAEDTFHSDRQPSPVKTVRPRARRAKSATVAPAPPSSGGNKYKSCCEQKPAEQMLPKYIGVISEYGLSQHQLELKMVRGEKRRRCRKELAFKKYQEQAERTVANEEAFAKWLKSKLAKTRKKYVNRFDDINGKKNKTG